MKGEMDPFFFLTSDKNFIPHEYPCRTALRRRTPRPPPGGARRPDAAPRTGCPSARPRSTSPASGSARPGSPPGRETARATARARRGPPAPRHLRRRGPVRERRRGRLAGRPTAATARPSAEIALDLPAGRQPASSVFFDDLAERDARYFVQLDWLDGPPARQAQSLRRRARGRRRGRSRPRPRCTSSARLDRRRGRAAPAPRPLPRRVTVAIEGECIHPAPPHPDPRGRRRPPPLPSAPPRACPPTSATSPSP